VAWQSLLPVVAVLASLLAAPAIVASRHRPNLREAATLLAATVKLGAVVALLPMVLGGATPEIALIGLPPGVDLALRVDAAGLVFALVASVLWLLTAVYAIGYVRQLAHPRQTRFFASFAVCLSTAVGLAFAANLLTFLVFYELLTVATYPLVVHTGSDAARAAGRRYLAYLLGGGAAILLATGLVYQAAGTLEFAAGGFVADHLDGGQLALVVALFTLGFGTKAALMPLHAWLPAAMVAPTPVSALLHAVAVVKAGIFGFVRAFGFVIGPDELAAVDGDVAVGALAVITLVGASVVALRQDDLKRRLAFSTVAHLSYIILGLSLATVTAWSGALLHLINHAALKITLFFCAGALHAGPHLDRVSELDGIGRRMPITMGAFGLASLGLAGVPPFGGFVSKWFLVVGAFDAGRWVFGAALLLAGLLSAAYLLPVVYRAFVKPGDAATVAPPSGPAPAAAGADVAVDHGHAPPAQPSWLLVAPLAVTALIALALGLGDVLATGELASRAAGAVTGGGP
jgi:formate hydrogenlyase subunit 3/multisubunit Na+/H+ antiporter MnhD subunit